MADASIKKASLGETLTGSARVWLLILFSVACQLIHFLRYPFPSRDSLTYLHILHFWNTTGSFTQVLEKFPKFGLLLFTFLPLKWAEKIGIPLYPSSVVWMILMSAVSVYAFYRIILLLTDNVKKAMICGALLAANPMILLYSGNLLRDTPYLMFSLLLALSFIYAVRDRKWYSFLLVGVTLAMCVLSRFESWELLLLCPLFSLFYMWKKQFKRGEVWRFVLLAALGFLGTILLMILAIDNLPFWYEKGKVMFLSFFPQWMGV